ncbi:MAG: hypothetical protein NT062_01930 [Proteobacteria bacterium]|nr:hypothetical protein [Pseudomonadota bacterium]
MSEIRVLVVTSSGASSAAVVPVLAAIEAAGMRVRAIDVGGAGGGDAGIADRVRRALLGENAERRLRKELEMSPPDAAVVFDPHAAIALTVARDQVPQIASPGTPVIAVVGDLDPAAAWANTDADRFVAIDELAAVALADAGVEGERVLVVGAIGERAFAEAGPQDRAALRARFKLTGKVALVEVAGLGAEQTSQLSLQLSLLDASSSITFLFDAAGDVEAAAVLRRQVPALGLKAKLFGASADQALLWRAADVIVARPRPEVVSRVMLVGAKLVALVDDSIAGSAKAAAAIEHRRRGIAAKGLLFLASALDSAFGAPLPVPSADGADNIADIVAAVAADKRGVIDERRMAAQAATRDRVRAANAAAQAVAATAAMPGDLEDLGGGGGAEAAFDAELPDKAELERLRAEVRERVAELTRSMNAAREAGFKFAAEAKAAIARGQADEAVQLEKRGDAERARMHALLGELAALESELRELEAVSRTLDSLPRTPPQATRGARGEPDELDDDFASPPPRASNLDDALAEMKRRAGGASGAPSATTPPVGKPGVGAPRPTPKGGKTVEDELAALKRKMASAPTPPKKK